MGLHYDLVLDSRLLMEKQVNPPLLPVVLKIQQIIKVESLFSVDVHYVFEYINL